MERDFYDLKKELWLRAESWLGALVVLVVSLLLQVSLIEFSGKHT